MIAGASATIFLRLFAVGFGIARAPADIEPYIAAIAPTKLEHGLLENFHPRLNDAVARKHADEFYARVLLRHCCEGPRRCSAADQANELAPLHIRIQGSEGGILAVQSSALIELKSFKAFPQRPAMSQSRQKPTSPDARAMSELCHRTDMLSGQSS
jgi:hypothetical protein